MGRGQAALEFVSTYGFAFLALLITIGVLSYTGIFSLASLRSDECELPQGFVCADFIVNRLAGTPTVRLIITNTHGVNLTMNLANVTFDEVTQNWPPCTWVPVGTWQPATNLTLTCPFPNAAPYAVRQRYTGIVTLNFTQSSGGTYFHAVKGLVSITSQ